MRNKKELESTQECLLEQ